MNLRNNLIDNKCVDCGICCNQTEMILSEMDILLILNQASFNLKREDFVQKNNEGYYQLKNLKGHCVFLKNDTKLCKIYEFRPQGCRFYPIIYDFDYKKCIYDKDCPRTDLFNLTKHELGLTCKSIKIFLQEEIKIMLSTS